MATLYALNLNFDPTAASGQFQPYNSSDNTGRAWWQNVNGGGWTFAGNPDTFAPELNLAAGDTVQFAVSASTTPSPAIQSVALTVIFATDRQAGNNPAKIASPFQNSFGNPRCVLSDPPGTYQSWFLIGPYGLAVNRTNSGNGKLKFEFSLAARVTFTDNSVKDFGYDPEMDVDV
jgi:hypothetical protein